MVVAGRASSEPIALTLGLPAPPLGHSGLRTKYCRGVVASQRYQVSSSGQLSLPAAVRRRWGLERGGPVEVIDLGFAVLTLPLGGAAELLRTALSRDDHRDFVRQLDDPDLQTT